LIKSVTFPPPPPISNGEGRTKIGEAVIIQESKYPDPPPLGRLTQVSNRKKKRKEKKGKEKKRKEKK